MEYNALAPTSRTTIFLKRALIGLSRSRLINSQQKRKILRNQALLTAACDKLTRTDRTAPQGGHALVVGDFSVNNGLGRAARYDMATFHDQHTSITTFDLTLGRFGAGTGPRRFDATYFLCQPDRFSTIADLIDHNWIAASYRVGRWVWETPKFPRDWLVAEKVVHEVWTPSQFCANVFQSSLNVPVKVVPHYVTSPPTNDIDMRTRFAISRDAFMGIAIMDLRSCPPRKNLMGNVRAWRAAFGNDPSAPFIIKVRVSKRTAVELDEARLVGSDCPNIRFVTEEFSDGEIAAFQHACDVYVSLHRAEGFGLNIREALLLNKPVVATHWSANAEYGPLFKSYLPVTFDLVPYKDWTHSYPDSDFKWAEPRIATAARLLKDLRSNHDEVRRHGALRNLLTE